MATTKNHKITGTLKKSIDYAMEDKIEDCLKDDIHDSIAYAVNNKTGKVTYITYTTTLNCKIGHPVETFNELISIYGKTEKENGSSRTKDGKPVLAWHYNQNFDGYVDPIIANEIGVKLAKEVFGNYPVVVSTHTNTANIHNHIIICAWDLNGKKWNQNNTAYRYVREVSDRLCEEYGLSVLRSTQKQKLIRWQDKDGQVHYYEPTERKNKLVHQRELGEITKDDVGSFRNTISYDKAISKKSTHREIIQQDIDRLIPVATSYGHLLEMLRQIGYKIKDKKKNGEWLKHIVYQPPNADKGTRDYKIGDGSAYLRENLERKIMQLQVTQNKEQATQKVQSLKYFEEYIYGKTVISDIDENVRIIRSEDGKFNTVNRGQTERIIIKNLKVMDAELRLIDTSKLDLAIDKKQVTNKHKYLSREKVVRIEEQIRESFHVLRFMEREDLYSQNQINTIVESTWAKYNDCIKTLDALENLVENLEAVLKVSDKIKNIEQRIERMKDDQNYKENELEADTAQIDKFKEIIKKFKLNNPESTERLAMQVAQSKNKIERLQGMLDIYRVRLEEYSRCVSVLERIDKEQGRDNEDYIKYKTIQRNGEKEAKETEEKRNSRRMKER